MTTVYAQKGQFSNTELRILNYIIHYIRITGPFNFKEENSSFFSIFNHKYVLVF
jgi:hypothetical protein